MDNSNILKILNSSKQKMFEATSVQDVKKIYREYRVWLRVCGYYGEIFSKDMYSHIVGQLKSYKKEALKYFFGEVLK